MTDTPWLDREQQRIWRAFLRMQAELGAQLGRQLQEDSALSLTDFQVLVQLTDVPEGQIRILELARGLQWEKSRLSHQLSRMEKRGLIARHQCPRDGRSTFIALTPAGRQAIEAAAPEHVRTVRRLLVDALTPEQLSTLGDIADRVLARIEAERR